MVKFLSFLDSILLDSENSFPSSFLQQFSRRMIIIMDRHKKVPDRSIISLYGGRAWVV